MTGLFFTYVLTWLLCRGALKDNTKMKHINVLGFFVTALCLFVATTRYTSAGYGFGFYNGIVFVFSLSFAYRDAVEDTEDAGVLAPSLGINILVTLATFIQFFL